MPDEDALSAAFGQLATAELPVPAVPRVLARGRQRRRQQRIMTSVAAVALVAIAGSAAAHVRHAAELHAASPDHGPVLSPGRELASQPPAESGQLLLGTGLVGSHRVFEMSRIGNSKAVRLSGLKTVTDAQSVIGPNPAGGWVVTEGVGSVSGVTSQAQLLATVSVTGVGKPFGPEFSKWDIFTSLAVRPDGSAVAVAVTHFSRSSQCLCSAARIELIPLPGHGLRVRTWTLASAKMTIVKSLSWGPDGNSLTYFPSGDQTGGGIATDGAATLDTARPGGVAPVTTDWPPFRKGSCNAVAGSWDGSSYLALERCAPSYRLQPVDPVTGVATGPAKIVPMPWACGAVALGPARAANGVMVSGCGTFLDSQGIIRTLPLPTGLTWVSAG